MSLKMTWMTFGEVIRGPEDLTSLILSSLWGETYGYWKDNSEFLPSNRLTQAHCTLSPTRISHRTFLSDTTNK